MGIQTMKYKITGWMCSAFFCGLAGGIMGDIGIKQLILTGLAAERMIRIKVLL